jgi:hypothetical protein
MTPERDIHPHPELGFGHDMALLDAIERHSESMARLLEACGSSRNFGPEERRQFERLLKRRRLLIARLEDLRSSGRPTRRISEK